MKDIDHFYAVVFLQYKNFITVTADSSRKKKIIEHSEIVEFKAVHSGEFNADNLEKAVKAYSIDNLRNIEKKEGEEKVPGVGTPHNVAKFVNIGLFQYQIKGCAGYKDLQKRFQQLFRVEFTVCQRSS